VSELLPDVTEHYFTGEPARDDERRRLTVRLAGREVEVEVASGVFSPGRLDPGTGVLLNETPTPPASGDLLDLGCGWGPITLSLALAAPDATVWAVDISRRALDLTLRNAQRLGLANVRTCLPDEVPTETRFAAIWSNPPIRVGKEMLHAMLGEWLPRLTPTSIEPVETSDGSGAWLVVHKNLGADSLARWIEADLNLTTRRATTSKGYRILHVSR